MHWTPIFKSPEKLSYPAIMNFSTYPYVNAPSWLYLAGNSNGPLTGSLFNHHVINQVVLEYQDDLDLFNVRGEALLGKAAVRFALESVRRGKFVDFDNTSLSFVISPTHPFPHDHLRPNEIWFGELPRSNKKRRMEINGQSTLVTLSPVMYWALLNSGARESKGFDVHRILSLPSGLLGGNRRRRGAQQKETAQKPTQHAKEEKKEHEKHKSQPPAKHHPAGQSQRQSSKQMDRGTPKSFEERARGPSESIKVPLELQFRTKDTTFRKIDTHVLKKTMIKITDLNVTASSPVVFRFGITPGNLASAASRQGQQDVLGLLQSYRYVSANSIDLVLQLASTQNITGEMAFIALPPSLDMPVSDEDIVQLATIRQGKPGCHWFRLPTGASSIRFNLPIVPGRSEYTDQIVEVALVQIVPLVTNDFPVVSSSMEPAASAGTVPFDGKLGTLFANFGLTFEFRMPQSVVVDNIAEFMTFTPAPVAGAVRGSGSSQQVARTNPITPSENFTSAVHTGLQVPSPYFVRVRRRSTHRTVGDEDDIIPFLLTVVQNWVAPFIDAVTGTPIASAISATLTLLCAGGSTFPGFIDDIISNVTVMIQKNRSQSTSVGVTDGGFSQLPAATNVSSYVAPYSSPYQSVPLNTMGQFLIDRMAAGSGATKALSQLLAAGQTHGFYPAMLTAPTSLSPTSTGSATFFENSNKSLFTFDTSSSQQVGSVGSLDEGVPFTVLAHDTPPAPYPLPSQSIGLLKPVNRRTLLISITCETEPDLPGPPIYTEMHKIRIWDVDPMMFTNDSAGLVVNVYDFPQCLLHDGLNGDSIPLSLALELGFTPSFCNSYQNGTLDDAILSQYFAGRFLGTRPSDESETSFSEVPNDEHDWPLFISGQLNLECNFDPAVGEFSGQMQLTLRNDVATESSLVPEARIKRQSDFRPGFDFGSTAHPPEMLYILTPFVL
jgi:hypothetical protein